MTIRTVVRGAHLMIYADDLFYFWMGNLTLLSGQPGVGARGTPAGNSVARVDLGPSDRVGPDAVISQSIGTSEFPTRVDIQWQGVLDDAIGSGVAFYQIYRNGSYLANQPTSELSDATVSASTTYTYTIYALDFHAGYSGPATFTVTTPPAGSIDPRRVGIRSTGSYWGAGNEQIDMLSGNLNFSLPLLKAQGRAGWSVPFALSYNSQIWRQDPGGTWKLGRDVGYGLGWKL